MRTRESDYSGCTCCWAIGLAGELGLGDHDPDEEGVDLAKPIRQAN